MRRWFIILLWLTVAVAEATDLEIYFSPNGGCTNAIIDRLDKAADTVLVQAYSFTSPPIAKALVDAKNRGVKVLILLDRGQEKAKSSEWSTVRDAGIKTKFDKKHAIAHNKVIIIDGITVITGSFNFTRSAEFKNAENLVIINDKDVAKKYVENWEIHDAHSE